MINIVYQEESEEYKVHAIAKIRIQGKDFFFKGKGDTPRLALVDLEHECSVASNIFTAIQKASFFKKKEL